MNRTPPIPIPEVIIRHDLAQLIAAGRDPRQVIEEAARQPSQPTTKRQQ